MHCSVRLTLALLLATASTGCGGGEEEDPGVVVVEGPIEAEELDPSVSADTQKIENAGADRDAESAAPGEGE